MIRIWSPSPSSWIYCFCHDECKCFHFHFLDIFSGNMHLITKRTADQNQYITPHRAITSNYHMRWWNVLLRLKSTPEKHLLQYPSSPPHSFVPKEAPYGCPQAPTSLKWPELGQWAQTGTALLFCCAGPPLVSLKRRLPRLLQTYHDG